MLWGQCHDQTLLETTVILHCFCSEGQDMFRRQNSLRQMEQEIMASSFQLGWRGLRSQPLLICVCYPVICLYKINTFSKDKSCGPRQAALDLRAILKLPNLSGTIWSSSVNYYFMKYFCETNTWIYYELDNQTSC